MSVTGAGGQALMRAVGINRFGGPEELTLMSVPQPQPLPAEVLVRVHAAGINPLDWRTRAGMPTPAAAVLGAPPHILGWEISGVVERAGAGEVGFSPGEEVFGLLRLPWPAGAYAEFVSAPAGQLARKPETIDHDHAAAVPLAGLTAWQVLTGVAGVEPGKRVLIHAAGGGVGHLAVQLAKHLGAHVTGTAGGGSHEWLRGLGADDLIDPRTTRFEQVARDIDVVVDLVGIVQPDTAARSLEVLRPGGLFISVAPGRPDEFAARAADAGIRVAPEFLVEPDGQGLARLAHLIDAGELQVRADRVFPMDQAAQAHRVAESGVPGRTVLHIADR